MKLEKKVLTTYRLYNTNLQPRCEVEAVVDIPDMMEAKTNGEVKVQVYVLYDNHKLYVYEKRFPLREIYNGEEIISSYMENPDLQKVLTDYILKNKDSYITADDLPLDYVEESEEELRRRYIQEGEQDGTYQSGADFWAEVERNNNGG